MPHPITPLELLRTAGALDHRAEETADADKAAQLRRSAHALRGEARRLVADGGFTDITETCTDCGARFTVEAAELCTYSIRRDRLPTHWRCAPCREKRKQQRRRDRESVSLERTLELMRARSTPQT